MNWLLLNAAPGSKLEQALEKLVTPIVADTDFPAIGLVAVLTYQTTFILHQDTIVIPRNDVPFG